MLLEVFPIGRSSGEAQAADAFTYTLADLSADRAEAGPPEPYQGQRPLEKEDTVAVIHDSDVLHGQKNDPAMLLTTDEHR